MKKGLLLLFLTVMTITVNAQATIESTTAGGSGNDWEIGTTWVGGVVPSPTDNVIINNTVRLNEVDVTIANITVAETGRLLLNTRSALTITGNLVNNRSGGVKFNNNQTEEMASLIIQGAVSGTGNIQAQYKLASAADPGRWYLMGVPVSGGTLTDFIAASTLRTNVGGENSIGVYDGNADPKYDYFTDAEAVGINLIDGKGYAVSVAVGSNEFIEINGQYNSAASVDISISDAGDGFNLLGNPYAAFLYANPDGDATNNLLTANSGVLEENTIWLYDSATSAFITRNLGDTGFDLATYQGFFVKAASGGGTFTFTEAMQTHNNSGSVFYKSANNRFEIDFKITDGENNSNASIRYIEGTTTGWDNGYDSSTFTGYATGNLEIATQLVANNVGKNLAIQSLPNQNLEATVIPLSITAEADKEVTISAAIKNVPEGINVYLEDREANTFTVLDVANPTFTFTPSKALSGAGRFYLHTKAGSALSTDTATLDNVSIFNTTNNTLKIIGLQSGNTSVKMFNILGKQVLTTSFDCNGAKEIALPNVSRGVYVVQVNNNNGKLSKKIILE
ncbi:T9SS type A sorting domain-containing protein [Polaribacter sp. Hel_I_88]|uniref:T9SS type A sorting domain-containing protein n=1 Tax=Polaribacter sp. Hel_I_88 TaxID=1250006 RepID=UPI00047D65E8|nr:T9SS type A sorting domain-containing protein [Polaribacter sp. Hel_I_88]